jgi:hypothetical protein
MTTVFKAVWTCKPPGCTSTEVPMRIQQAGAVCKPRTEARKNPGCNTSTMAFWLQELWKRMSVGLPAPLGNP